MKLLPLIVLFQISGSLFAQDLSPREKKLLDDVERLEARVAALENRLGLTNTALPIEKTTSASSPETDAPKAATAEIPDPLGGTTVNVILDSYYLYNFNRPIGRDNLLRAYDVSSHSFSINQADAIVENAPNPARGKRWGARVDLQFGQATQTLQGNPANEPRPELYRNIFQAYGTYVFPVGGGLTVDFGKWSSSLGIEGNYSKDQMNYSRSYLFTLLPFYHTGVRANYAVNGSLALNYWLTNGTQQTESLNNFKDELFGLSFTPRKNVSWNLNYYLGQEHPDVAFYNNSALNSPAAPTDLPTLQGVPFAPIESAPGGRLHIFDSYLTWKASPKLTFSFEGDYVVQRLFRNSSPDHAIGAAAYARHQLTPKLAFAGRAEYLSDRGGQFSGATQALKEATFTMEYKVAEGFLVREEWRRDWSNHPYFLTNALGKLKKEQNTAAVGLVWWFGRKSGVW